MGEPMTTYDKNGRVLSMYVPARCFHCGKTAFGPIHPLWLCKEHFLELVMNITRLAMAHECQCCPPGAGLTRRITEEEIAAFKEWADRSVAALLRAADDEYIPGLLPKVVPMPKKES